MKIAKLHLTSFRGFSIGAEHYYGKISYRPPFESKWSNMDPRNLDIEVENEMTQEQADKLNEKDDYTWRAGDPNSRYDTPDLVARYAIPIFENHFDPNEDLLIMGWDLYDEWEFDKFRRVVAGKPGIVKQFEGLDLKEAGKLASELGIVTLLRGY